jgi:hypothetical protein
MQTPYTMRTDDRTLNHFVLSSARRNYFSACLLEMLRILMSPHTHSHSRKKIWKKLLILFYTHEIHKALKVYAWELLLCFIKVIINVMLLPRFSFLLFLFFVVIPFYILTLWDIHLWEWGDRWILCANYRSIKIHKNRLSHVWIITQQTKHVLHLHYFY